MCSSKRPKNSIASTFAPRFPVAVILLFSLSLLSISAYSATTASSYDVAHTVRVRLEAFEAAWNAGDVPNVLAQYDASVEVFSQSEHWGYDKQVSLIRGLMEHGERPRYAVDIESIRVLSSDLALINGQFHLFAKEGNVQSGVFSVIYRRFDGTWRLIYVHS